MTDGPRANRARWPMLVALLLGVALGAAVTVCALVWTPVGGSVLAWLEQRQADAQLRLAAQSGPPNPRAQAQLAVEAASSGHIGEGVQGVRRAVQLAPDDPEVWMDFGQVFQDVLHDRSGNALGISAGEATQSLRQSAHRVLDLSAATPPTDRDNLFYVQRCAWLESVLKELGEAEAAGQAHSLAVQAAKQMANSTLPGKGEMGKEWLGHLMTPGQQDQRSSRTGSG